MPDSPRARALAKELRAARDFAGLTLRDVAERVGCSEGQISRLETGRRGLTVTSTMAMLDALDLQGEARERLLKMARDMHQPGWWEFGGNVPLQLTQLAEAEEHATRVTSVSQIRITGLLQTREYSRALFRATQVPPEQIEQLIAIRQVRQGVLSKDDAPEYLAVLDEAVLSRAVGGPPVMAEQLRWVLKMMTMSNVTVRVVPFSVGAHTGMDGSFVLLEFVRAKTLVHLEQRRSGAFLDDPKEVAAFLEARSSLQRSAMSADESAALIAEYAQRYEREE